MRSPLGTYLARPSGHDSLISAAGSIHLRPYFAGMPAESICCQMLCRHSLAALDDAVTTILGERNERASAKALNRNVIARLPLIAARILASCIFGFQAISDAA